MSRRRRIGWPGVVAWGSVLADGNPSSAPAQTRRDDGPARAGPSSADRRGPVRGGEASCPTVSSVAEGGAAAPRSWRSLTGRSGVGQPLAELGAHVSCQLVRLGGEVAGWLGKALLEGRQHRLDLLDECLDPLVDVCEHASDVVPHG